VRKPVVIGKKIRDTPLIFLDVDGVLNTNTYVQSVFERFSESKKESAFDLFEFMKLQIDPDLVKRFKILVDTSGAKIVVSSSWRHGHMDVLWTVLLEHGISDESIIGQIGSECPSCVRGNMIRKWINDNVIDYHKFTRYVIFDDDSDMLLWQKFNFIQTDPEIGITVQQVQKAQDILRKGIV
jgi:histidinol phosphatase-like enzyme